MREAHPAARARAASEMHGGSRAVGSHARASSPTPGMSAASVREQSRKAKTAAEEQHLRELRQAAAESRQSAKRVKQKMVELERGTSPARLGCNHGVDEPSATSPKSSGMSEAKVTPRPRVSDVPESTRSRSASVRAELRRQHEADQEEARKAAQAAHAKRLPNSPHTSNDAVSSRFEPSCTQERPASARSATSEVRRDTPRRSRTSMALVGGMVAADSKQRTPAELKTPRCQNQAPSPCTTACVTDSQAHSTCTTPCIAETNVDNALSSTLRLSQDLCSTQRISVEEELLREISRRSISPLTGSPSSQAGHDLSATLKGSDRDDRSYLHSLSGSLARDRAGATLEYSMTLLSNNSFLESSFKGV